MNKALHSVLDERQKQDQKWGIQDHHPLLWLAIITEEVGELAQEIIEIRKTTELTEWREHVRIEAVQVAAAALAMIEAIDRNVLSSGDEDKNK